MRFKNRTEAGKLLAQALAKYKGQPAVVFALPRGGVVPSVEIARDLGAPLDLLLAHKVGHPYQPEYAIAAVSEDGHIIANAQEMQRIDKRWFESEVEHQMQEIKRKREKYLKGKKESSLQDKIAILVDDGIATGLTMQAGVLELKEKHPRKIIVAVPVSPKSTAQLLQNQVDEFVGIQVPNNEEFLGAIGAYYDDFSQVEDEEVIAILENYAKELEKSRETTRE
jgi:putative phosphoribosyl transferase